MGRLIRQLLFIALIGGVLYGMDITNPSADPVYTKVSAYLKGSPVPADYIRSVFSDAGIKTHAVIVEKFRFPHEKKPYLQYRRIFITEKRIQGGVIFYRKNKTLVDSVSTQYGVDPVVLVSIVGVESNYGSNHAEFTVFNSLYTIVQSIPRRSRWAVKELGEFLKLCYVNDIDPHSVNGSYAGAFGYGQFIPSSFNNYAVDFDGDGVRHHLQWPDVLASVANYLVKNGYKPGDQKFVKGSSIYKSIYAYNHSHNYVRVILELREEVRKRQ